MNDLPPDAHTRCQAAETLFSHYELWLAERMPKEIRDAVFWHGEKIEYEQLKEDLEGERMYFVAPSPYPGLRSFTPQEGRVFFGRRSDVDEVRARLKAHRMVMVLGGSGSGKSSLVRAGVLPHLNGVGRIGGRGGTWYWCEFRPEQAALDNFIAALAKHVVTPLVKVIAERSKDQPELVERLAALGLSTDTDLDRARDWVAAPFEAASNDEDRFEALWSFVDSRLDRLDDLAGGGIRAGKPNLLILLDQFEEIFREAPTDEQEWQTSQLLGLLARMDAKLRQPPWSEGGLFMALTMRSEELHRCGEHDGLTNLVNRSIFLLELLDAERPADREVLHRAIVEPARRVFISYGLYERDDFAGRLKGDEDAPFEEGVPDWLIDGSKEQWAGLEHRPDQLPLLQHAIRATWDQAITRWKKDKVAPEDFRIEKQDLPGDDLNTPYPDLDHCLSFRADCAAMEARGRFRDPLAEGAPAHLSETKFPAGEAALRAAFTALARQDDRGNRARRFATIQEMIPFLENDKRLQKFKPLEPRLEKALAPLIFHGYLSGGCGRPYDISHEALIRNWERCTGWLRENEEVVRALRRFLDEINPTEFDTLTDQAEIADRIPGAFRGQIARIGGKDGVPEAWARDQLELLLRGSAERRRVWLGGYRSRGGTSAEEAASVLSRIQEIADRSLKAREIIREEKARADERDKQFRAIQESERQAREAAKEAREAEAKERQAAEEARKAQEQAQQSEKVAERRLKGAIALVTVLALVTAASVFLWWRSDALSDIAGRERVLSMVETRAAEEWSYPAKLGTLEVGFPKKHNALLIIGNTSANHLAAEWDRIARETVGLSFWLTKPSFSNYPAASCWSNDAQKGWIADEGTDDGSLPKFPGPKEASIRADGRDLKLSIKRDGILRQELDLTKGGPLPPLDVGAKLCVSQDASILSVSLANGTIPNIYYLYLLNCRHADGCALSFRQIFPSIARPKDGRQSQSIPNLAWPREPGGLPEVDYIRLPERNGDHVAVGFTRTYGHPQSGTGQSAAEFEANFRIGWSTPKRVGLSSEPIEVCGSAVLATSPFLKKNKALEQRATYLRWTCSDATRISEILREAAPERTASRGTGLVKLLVLLKKSDGSGRGLRQITAWGPPDAHPVTVRNGALIMKDEDGDYWSINVDESKLRGLVETAGDSNPDLLPDEVVRGASWLKRKGGR